MADDLPILPLRETVVFPDSMTPLAIGQERSIKLVDEAVAKDSTIALVTTRETADEEEATSTDDIYEVGTAALIHKMIRVPDGTLRVLVQGLRRVHLDRIVQTEPYLVGEFSRAPGRRRPREGGRRARAQRRGPLQPDHRARPLSPGRAPARRRERRGPEHARQPHRHDDATQDTREAGAPRGGVDRGAPAQAHGRPEPRARGARAWHEDPVAGAVGDGELTARVLPPPAAQGDPGGARRGRRAAGRDRGAPRPDRGGTPPRGGGPRRAPRARPLDKASARRRGVWRHPRLPRMDPLASLERDDRGQPRPRARTQRSSTRTTTTSRRSRSGSSSSSRSRS